MRRRVFLSASASLLAAAAWPLPAGVDRLTRIGLQLYTVRDVLAHDFEGTLARVAEIGYRDVEFAGYFGHGPREVRAALDRHGLVAPAAHVPIELLGTNWTGALEDAHVIGHHFLVVAWIPAEQRRTLDDYKRTAQLFNRAGEAARAAGLEFAYHNHDFEFAPLAGTRPYDVLLAECDPARVRFEMDLFWITKGGGDPLAYFAAHRGRFPMVHVKDMKAGGEMTEVGSGVIAWKEILARRAQAGIEHCFVEHDQPADPFVSIRASFEYLRQLEF